MRPLLMQTSWQIPLLVLTFIMIGSRRGVALPCSVYDTEPWWFKNGLAAVLRASGSHVVSSGSSAQW